LAEVVEPRYEELFKLVQAELRRSGFEDLVASGIVLTGGSSKMEGVVELAEEIFHMPVSLGHPKYITGLNDIVRNPVYATGVGLLLYGQSREEETHVRGRGTSSGYWNRMRQWMTDNF
jgi:cell division protein FtsA